MTLSSVASALRRGDINLAHDSVQTVSGVFIAPMELLAEHKWTWTRSKSEEKKQEEATETARTSPIEDV